MIELILMLCCDCDEEYMLPEDIECCPICGGHDLAEI